MAALPTSWVKDKEDLVSISEPQLAAAHVNILQVNVDIVSDCIANESSEGRKLLSPPNLNDAENAYDIVYSLQPRKAKGHHGLRPRDTIFGFGMKAKTLCVGALVADEVLLRHRMLVDAAQFRAVNKNGNLKVEKGDKKRRKEEEVAAKANRLAQNSLLAGYDCASIPNDSFARVYWIPSAVVPLYILDVQNHKMCVICIDDCFPTQGWVCRENHFICRACFEDHLDSAKGPDALERSVDADGNLKCPHVECHRIYDAPHLLTQTHDASEKEIKDLHSSLEKLRSDAHAKKKVTEAVEVEKNRMLAEFERIQKIQNAKQRAAEIIKLEIVDQILTLRCPNENCRMAFVDFTGCFALTCGRYRTGFFAWCLKRPGGNESLHGHVTSCPEATHKGVSHSFDSFTEHHRVRRTNRVVLRLQEEEGGVQKLVLGILRAELQDLNIQISLTDL